ncbi:MAG: peptidoglycan editing factor PgeF, partial [Ignavibacteria bacterium]|nr:peptidoglycan editing factor PgeF [Ignavibacteria bacterium]
DTENIKQNRARFFGSLGIPESKLVHANQVHGANITRVSKAGLYPETDALITNTPDIYLVISIADCMPVMLYDPVNNAIANIHSGWRGTQKNIAGNTVERMKEEFGTDAGGLIAFMGPAISKKNFEVDEDVAAMFPAVYTSRKPDAAGKFIVDTGQMVFDQLIDAGVNAANIERCTYCTFDSHEHLHSYRRDKHLSGRMFAVLGMKP